MIACIKKWRGLLCEFFVVVFFLLFVLIVKGKVAVNCRYITDRTVFDGCVFHVSTWTETNWERWHACENTEKPIGAFFPSRFDVHGCITNPHVCGHCGAVVELQQVKYSKMGIK